LLLETQTQIAPTDWIEVFFCFFLIIFFSGEQFQRMAFLLLTRGVYINIQKQFSQNENSFQLSKHQYEKINNLMLLIGTLR